LEAIPQPVLLIVRFLDLRCLRRTAKDAHASGLDWAATGDPYTCPTLNALAHERVRVRHRKVVDARTWEHVGRFELGHELRHTELVLLKAGALLRLFREEVEFLLDRCGTVTAHHRHQARCPSESIRLLRDLADVTGKKRKAEALLPLDVGSSGLRVLIFFDREKQSAPIAIKMLPP
jgi:hypothetical protein